MRAYPSVPLAALFLAALFLVAAGACGGSAPADRDVPRGAATSHEMLPPPRPGEVRLAGRIVDEDRGVPMVGCTVALSLAGTGGAEILHAETRTNADGFFVFSDLAPGTARLRAAARGYETQHVSLAFPFPDTPYVLALRRGGTIAGIVLAPGGRPAAGALVRAHGPDPSMDASMQVRANSAGVFSLQGMPRAPLLLEASLGPAHGALSEPVTPDAEHIVIHLRQDPPGRTGGDPPGRRSDAPSPPPAPPGG